MIFEWMQRLVEESEQLDARLEKLYTLLSHPTAVVIHRALMERQAKEIAAYAATLHERINRFPEITPVD